MPATPNYFEIYKNNSAVSNTKTVRYFCPGNGRSCNKSGKYKEVLDHLVGSQECIEAKKDGVTILKPGTVIKPFRDLESLPKAKSELQQQLLRNHNPAFEARRRREQGRARYLQESQETARHTRNEQLRVGSFSSHADHGSPPATPPRDDWADSPEPSGELPGVHVQDAMERVPSENDRLKDLLRESETKIEAMNTNLREAQQKIEEKNTMVKQMQDFMINQQQTMTLLQNELDSLHRASEKALKKAEAHHSAELERTKEEAQEQRKQREATDKLNEEMSKVIEDLREQNEELRKTIEQHQILDQVQQERNKEMRQRAEATELQHKRTRQEKETAQTQAKRNKLTQQRQQKQITTLKAKNKETENKLKDANDCIKSQHQKMKHLEEKGEKGKNRLDGVRKAYQELIQEITVKKESQEVKVDNLESTVLCCICLTENRSLCFKPCYHVATCRDCGEDIAECPLCRKEIVSKDIIYY